MSAHLVAAGEDGSVARARAVSTAAVLAAAHAECQARGWPWREPAKVTGGLFRFKVWTNANAIDDSPWFVFSRDKRPLRAGWTARKSRQ
jgi:hypothetical protein